MGSEGSVLSPAPSFELVPARTLLPHEQIDEADVERLASDLRKRGLLEEPIWVARRERVILNGHHRFAALQRLGARWVPAWVIDYADPEMELARWGSGPPLTKQEVIRRARAGELFPPKTSRHIWHGPTPAPHPTTLAELQAERPGPTLGSVPREGGRPGGPR